MLISKENLKIRNVIEDFEKRIEDMHLEFDKYRCWEIQKMPEWENLEKDLFIYSKKKIFDLELTRQLDRVTHKFQNRKRIWLRWVEEMQ